MGKKFIISQILPHVIEIHVSITVVTHQETDMLHMVRKRNFSCTSHKTVIYIESYNVTMAKRSRTLEQFIRIINKQ